jgi:hypothetical protein
MAEQKLTTPNAKLKDERTPITPPAGTPIATTDPVVTPPACTPSIVATEPVVTPPAGTSPVLTPPVVTPPVVTPPVASETPDEPIAGDSMDEMDTPDDPIAGDSLVASETPDEPIAGDSMDEMDTPDDPIAGDSLVASETPDEPIAGDSMDEMDTPDDPIAGDSLVASDSVVAPPIGQPTGAAKAITDKGASAIAIDNDLDGLGSIPVNDGPQFDIFNNGTPVKTGWISKDDSLLAIDNNGNGKIDNGSELFGGGVGQGFAKLGTFDSTGDGIIDAKDTDFGKLKAWNDANTNGVTDAGELLTFSDIGLQSLKLGFKNDFSITPDGNVFGETSSAPTKDGKAFELISVYFPTESSLSTTLG